MSEVEAFKLLGIDEKAKAYAVGQALEAYGIAAHYADGEHPDLVDSEPLRALLDRYARAAVAVALSTLGSGTLARMHEVYLDYFNGLAVDLDVQAVEINDGA
jgi:hypothetical protein